MLSPLQSTLSAPARVGREHTHVRKARHSELPATASALAAAFADDPVFAYCFPDAGRRARAIPAFFDLVVETLQAYREIYTVDDRRPGRAVGGAVWVPPGKPAVPHDAEQSFDTRLAQIAGPDIERIGEVMGVLERHHPSALCAHLWFVGVAPGSQGGGLGSALMAPMLQRCDAEEMPAYLEATSVRNRELYKRHGFQVVTEMRIPGGPSMWSMWREPRAVSSVLSWSALFPVARVRDRVTGVHLNGAMDSGAGHLP